MDSIGPIPLPTSPSGLDTTAASAASAAATTFTTDDNGQTHVVVGLNALLIVLTISTALWLSHLIKKIKLYWLSDSGAAMILGVIIGFIVNVFGSTSHHHLMLFEPELFFFILLPPIIFEAGYSMKKAAFFYNVGSILLFAVFGTLISTLIVGYGLFGLAKINFIDLDSDNPIECLIFGSLISAVDPVAVLSILQNSRLKSPLIYSLIFGESVINDAVSIVLFHTFHNFQVSMNKVGSQTRIGSPTSTSGPLLPSETDSSASEAAAAVAAFDHFTIGALFLDFILVSIGSLWIGVLVGLMCSFLFRNSNLSKTPEVEFTLIIFFAYTAYCLSEILGLSGIMSLFFCSIIMAHYNWYNMSLISRSTTKHAFKSFALISETFLFAYLGISAVVSARSVLHLEWSISLIFFTLILCLISRALHIFPLSFLSNLVTATRNRNKISKRSSSQVNTATAVSPQEEHDDDSSSAAVLRRVNESINSTPGGISLPIQIFLCFSSIRGAIAFALSLNVFTNHRSLIVSTTMMIVIMTTIVFGGMTSPMLRRLKLVEESSSSSSSSTSSAPARKSKSSKHSEDHRRDRSESVGESNQLIELTRLKGGHDEHEPDPDRYLSPPLSTNSVSALISVKHSSDEHENGSRSSAPLSPQSSPSPGLPQEEEDVNEVHAASARDDVIAPNDGDAPSLHEGRSNSDAEVHRAHMAAQQQLDRQAHQYRSRSSRANSHTSGDEYDSHHHHDHHLEHDFDHSDHDDDNDNGDEEDNIGCLPRLWRRFDENHMQEWFGGYAHEKIQHPNNHNQKQRTPTKRKKTVPQQTMLHRKGSSPARPIALSSPISSSATGLASSVTSSSESSNSPGTNKKPPGHAHPKVDRRSGGTERLYDSNTAAARRGGHEEEDDEEEEQRDHELVDESQTVSFLSLASAESLAKTHASVGDIESQQ